MYVWGYHNLISVMGCRKYQENVKAEEGDDDVEMVGVQCIVEE